MTSSPEAKPESTLSCFWYLGFELTALVGPLSPLLFCWEGDGDGPVLPNTAPSQLLSLNSEPSCEGPASSPCFSIAEVPRACRCPEDNKIHGLSSFSLHHSQPSHPGDPTLSVRAEGGTQARSPLSLERTRGAAFWAFLPVLLPLRRQTCHRSQFLSTLCVTPPFEAVPKKGVRADLALRDGTEGAGSPALPVAASSPFPPGESSSETPRAAAQPPLTRWRLLCPWNYGEDGHRGQQDSPPCPAPDCPPLT